ncbi:MAG TPA: choice-of-anchor tandem repeat GloVer-containing protein [Terriglobales bacterium]|nr:choice-of-anchor tandem repeat GloVer-containing protein [Terriglobales bacterium]
MANPLRNRGWTLGMQVLALAITATLSVQAQTFKVLHTFHGAPNDGAVPLGALVRVSNGDLYGTTNTGGSGCTSESCGTAFKMDKNGNEVWMHSFDIKNGGFPDAGLIRDKAGNLFGTTVVGGDHTKCSLERCGVVFKLNDEGNEVTLYNFKGEPDGGFPEARLVRDDEGNVYGTTYSGGLHEEGGTIFKIDPEHNEAVLYNFCSLTNCSDGLTPYPGLIRDASGNLFGVAASGGERQGGVAYELDSKGNESTLYNFGTVDGSGPASVLVEDSSGNLYGTTSFGGNVEQCGGNGCGVVFKLSPMTGGGWSETVMYSFCALKNCADGSEPMAGPLVLDAAGNIYGTTYSGGTTCNTDGCGVVFKLDPAGKETVLHAFTGGNDGAFPWAGVTLDRGGNLYGVASQAGDTKCYGGDHTFGCGVVFKITP